MELIAIFLAFFRILFTIKVHCYADIALIWCVYRFSYLDQVWAPTGDFQKKAINTGALM